MTINSKILIFGQISKIEEKIIYVNRNDFQGPHLNYQDITIPLSLKKQIENSVIGGKPFLKLFEYDGVSLWWLFHYGPFFNNHFSKAVNFVSIFSEFIKSQPLEKIIISNDFEMLPIIEQICIDTNIKLEFSKFQYMKFRYLKKFKKFLQKHVRQYKFKKRIKNRIKNRVNEYSKKFNSVPNIDNKVIFAIPTTFRRSYYNPDTMRSERGEYVFQEIINILKNNHELLGMSIENSNNTENDTILTERLASDLDWFPQELIFKNYLKKSEHRIFLKNFKQIMLDKKFQDLFMFNNIKIWSQIQPVFEQMQEEIYIPYWLHLIDHLSNFLTNKKPKTVFLIGETDAPALALIHVCRKNKIKTITIQHGDAFEDCEHNISNLYSKESPLGCPFPNKMLIFGKFAKDQFVKHGYPEQLFSIIGNPLFINLKRFDDSKIDQLYKKYKIPPTKNIILSTTSRYQGFSEKYNFDELVWDNLLKNFALKNNFFLILKPHPYEDITSYEKIFSKYNQPENAKIIDGDILELIQLSNLLVSSFSTSIVDAICLKKPVIEMIWDGVQQEEINFNDFHITIPSTLKQLPEQILSLLNNKSIQENTLKNREQFLHYHFSVPINLDNFEKTLNELL